MEWRLERVRREGGGIAMGRGRGRKRGSSTGAEQLRSLFSLSFFFSFLFFKILFTFFFSKNAPEHHKPTKKISGYYHIEHCLNVNETRYILLDFYVAVNFLIYIYFCQNNYFLHFKI